ncbi:MAG: hypothetical protein ACREWI_14115 [Telluria sp.]
MHARPRSVTIDGRAVATTWHAKHKLLDVPVPARRRQNARIAIVL